VVKLSHETLRLHFPEKGPAWKYWVQTIQDDFDNDWIINRFNVTNVRETRSFKYTPEGQGKWSKGSIVPCYVWDEQEGRIFSSFLAMNTAGLSLLAFEFSDKLKSKLLSNNVTITDGKTIDGLKTLILRSKNIKSGSEGEIHVTVPHFLVVHNEVRLSKENYSVVYHVEQTGFFEGICYPKSGSLHQSSMQNIDQVDYEFEVTDIRRFDPTVLFNWFPEWPTSTGISDTKTGENTAIPPNERQLAKVAKEAEIEAEQMKRYHLLPIRIVIMVLALALIVWSIYRMITSKKSSTDKMV
jgi:hypothetical protein